MAEDNEVNLIFLTRFLQTRKISYATARDGAEAVELCKARNFQLVFMDCQMPKLDGYQATEAIRLASGSDTAPWIVALTGNAMDGDRARCLAAGMNDYLSKPVKITALEQALQRFVSHISVE